MLNQARKLIILVIGSTVILFGIILLFTPGPAFIVIPIGLAILATEFAWARRILKKVKEKIRLDQKLDQNKSDNNNNDNNKHKHKSS